ncbi:DNA-binding transcriptional regulator, LysR family [Pseudonocardia oroxyli]|uniref:DNA-binding transcriptional regulator, LysR family n=2 Tax=Pseudonocardia oroxyli TaxID=366584 RepID=A0A1G8DTS2_PSEOR|nr:DNA-binding transcriptional regulator, LysR family [Pseudonocardia oroxyli]
MRVAHNRSMEIRELGWFTLLAEREHVTEAAEHLNVAQSTLSRAVARLERRLGVPLFDRAHNRLRLNEYGEILRAHALRALAEISAAEQRIAALADPGRGTLSVGFLHSFGGWLLPGLLAGYRAESPGVAFRLSGGAADTVVDGVRAGSLDVAFTSPRPAGDDLLWTELGDERLGLLVPEAHPLAERESVAVEELAQEQFVALERLYGLRQVADRLCAAAGVLPRVVMEATELVTVRSLVAAGLGVAIVPAPRPGDAVLPGVRDVAIADRGASRAVGMIVAAHGTPTPAARRFREFVRARHTEPPS